jgi:hypothetical protein
MVEQQPKGRMRTIFRWSRLKCGALRLTFAAAEVRKSSASWQSIFSSDSSWPITAWPSRFPLAQHSEKPFSEPVSKMSVLPRVISWPSAMFPLPRSPLVSLQVRPALRHLHHETVSTCMLLACELASFSAVESRTSLPQIFTGKTEILAADSGRG